jgi:hypothetical protein
MDQRLSSSRATSRPKQTERTALVKLLRFTKRIALLITEEVAWRALVLLLLVPMHFPGSHG